MAKKNKKMWDKRKIDKKWEKNRTPQKQ